MRNAANDLDVPGFRRGKAPKDVVEKRLGKDYISRKAFEHIFYEILFDVVTQEKLDVIDVLKVGSFELLPQKPLTFSVTVELKPTITLGKYKGLKVKAKKFLYDKEVFIKKTLEKIANNLAVYHEVKTRVAKLGDKVTLDFHGKFSDGTDIPGGSAKNYEVILEKDKFLPEFIDKLLGLKTEEATEIKISFPENYTQDLSGKEALFNVTLKMIEEKVVPDIDDELARKVNVSNLEDLKAKIETEMQKVQENNSKIDFENKLVDEIIKSSRFEISNRMIDKEIDSVLDNFKSEHKRQGKNWNEFKSLEKNKELLAKAKEIAIKRISIDLVLGGIIKKECISTTKEEIDAEISTKILQYGEQYKNLQSDKRFINIVELSILRNKAVDYLTDNNEPLWEDEIIKDVGI